MTRLRTRKWSSPNGASLRQGIVGSPGTSYSPSVVSSFETCLDETHKGPPFRSGGPLEIKRKLYTRTFSTLERLSHDNFFVPGQVIDDYNGRFWVDVQTDDPNPQPPNIIDLSGWGAKGWNRALPVKPILNIGQFVYELKDLPEMFSQTRDFFKIVNEIPNRLMEIKKFFSGFKGSRWEGRSADFWGGQYLNYQFGWKPFLDDFFGILSFGDRLAKQRAFLIKNNRRPVWRHVTLSNNRQETVLQDSQFVGSGLQPPLGSSVRPPGSLGSIHNTKVVENRIWFEGQFQFYIPEADMFGANWNPGLSAKLAGLRPDLNLIWKVAPWTWLLDWFLSVGPAVSNFSLMEEFDQVAKYAYVMSTQKVEYVSYGTHVVYKGHYGPLDNFSHTVFQNASAVLSLETKQREVASPYGFGLTWSDFNQSQLSILTALGLSRSKFSI
jgi:hypothetical protein